MSESDVITNYGMEGEAFAKGENEMGGGAMATRDVIEGEVTNAGVTLASEEEDEEEELAVGRRDFDSDHPITQAVQRGPITLKGEINVGATINKSEVVYNDNRVVNRPKHIGDVMNVTINNTNIYEANSTSMINKSASKNQGLRKRKPVKATTRKQKNKGPPKKNTVAKTILPAVKQRLATSKWTTFWKTQGRAMLWKSVCFVLILLVGVSIFYKSTSSTHMKDPATQATKPAKAEHSRPTVGKAEQEKGSHVKDDKPGQNLQQGSELHQACRRGSFEVVVELLQDQQVDVNEQNPSGDTALYIASAAGHIAIVKQLLRHGANVDVNNRLGRTPLHEASRNGHAEVVVILCQYNATINVIDFEEITPLVDASKYGRKDVVQFLTEFEAEVNEPREMPTAGSGSAKKPLNIPKLPDIQLPLMSAVKSGYDDIARILLKKGARVNVPDSQGWMEVHMAAYYGHISIVEMLLDHGADVDAVTKQRATPLILASQQGHVDVVSLLLQRGTDVNHAQEDGATAIMLAAQSGHDDVVTILHEHEAATTVNLNGKPVNALTLAVNAGHSHTAVWMIRSFKFDLGLASELLLLASFKGDVKVVELLLALGTDTEVKMETGATPLILAAIQGHVDVVKALLSHGADLTAAVASISLTPLSGAIFKGHAHVVDVILDHDKELVNTGFGPEGLLPLECALPAGNLEVFNTLLQHGADPSLKGASNRKNLYPIPVLCTAISQGNVTFVKTLLRQGASLNQPCFANITPLIWAVSKGQTESVQLLLYHGAEPYLRVGSRIISLMNYAAYEGNTDVVELLVNLTFDTEEADPYTFLTPIGMAAISGHANVVELLLKRGANKDFVSESGTPLLRAAESGHTDVVKVLLQHKADTELAAKKSGATPLIGASENGHTDIVRLLLENGANPNARTQILLDDSDLYKFPLNVFRNVEQTDILDYIKPLISDNRNKKSKSASKTYIQITALSQATVFNNTDVVRLLLRYGANTEFTYSSFDNVQFTLLHMACLFGRKEITKMLLEAGADVNARLKLLFSIDVTPLDMADCMKYTDIISVLLEHGAYQSLEYRISKATLDPLQSIQADCIIMKPILKMINEKIFDYQKKRLCVYENRVLRN